MSKDAEVLQSIYHKVKSGTKTNIIPKQENWQAQRWGETICQQWYKLCCKCFYKNISDSVVNQWLNGSYIISAYV